MHHELDAVQVFDLTSRPKRLAFATYRYIGIAAQRSFIHVAIGCTHAPQKLPQFPHVGTSLLGRAQPRRTDNLDEGNARTIVVQQADMTPRISSGVNGLARVLLELQLLNGHVQRRVLRGKIAVPIANRYDTRVRKRFCVSSEYIRRFCVIW